MIVRLVLLFFFFFFAQTLTISWQVLRSFPLPSSVCTRPAPSSLVQQITRSRCIDLPLSLVLFCLSLLFSLSLFQPEPCHIYSVALFCSRSAAAARRKKQTNDKDQETRRHPRSSANEEIGSKTSEGHYARTSNEELNEVRTCFVCHYHFLVFLFCSQTAAGRYAICLSFLCFPSIWK